MKKPAKKRRAKKNGETCTHRARQNKKDQSAGADEIACESCAQAGGPGAKKSFGKKNQESWVKKTRAPAVTARRAPKEVLGEGNYSRAEIPPGRDKVRSAPSGQIANSARRQKRRSRAASGTRSRMPLHAPLAQPFARRGCLE